MSSGQTYTSQSPILSRGLTFDDVLLIPQYSELLPHETCISSSLTRRIQLSTPLVSAAMDTVTEARTAIVMAQLGGLGIIHKNLSIGHQAREVQQVKRSESGMISHPVSIADSSNVGEAMRLMNTYKISGLPVMDEHNRLVGIVTGRDIRFEHDPSKPITAVMTKKVITADENTTPAQAGEILQKHRIEKLPVLALDGKTLVGMFTFKDIEKTNTNPHAAKDSKGRLLAGAAIGATGDYRERAEALLEAGCDVLVVDTAHGHSKGVIEAVKELRVLFKNKHDFDIIAGNVAHPEGVKALAQAGADAVKVGIGPGSICTTRIVAGIGVPQLTAILNCAEAGKACGIPILADGGVKYSGDLAKALAAGASVVMIGNLFAGTDEAPGDLILFQGKSFKSYRGMGSIGAMVKGSKDRYFQGDIDEQKKLVPEGIEGRVPYKGALAHSVYQLVGGLRSAMGYLGAKTIPAMQEKAQFMLITPQGLRESHAHDVYITHEAPNYSKE